MGIMEVIDLVQAVIGVMRSGPIVIRLRLQIYHRTNLRYTYIL